MPARLLLLLLCRQSTGHRLQTQATSITRHLCLLDQSRRAGSGRQQEGETVCAAPQPRNLGNCTCNFPSCWRGWDHARRLYLCSWRDQEDSSGTQDFVPPARLLCNRARTGLPGPSLTHFLSFCLSFSISLPTAPAHDQAIDPKAHGSWRVPFVPLLLPIGVSPALEVPPRQQARVQGTCLPCFRPNVLACFTLFNFVCVSPKLPWHAFSLLS